MERLSPETDKLAMSSSGRLNSGRICSLKPDRISWVTELSIGFWSDIETVGDGMVGGQETRPGRGRDDDQTNKNHNSDQKAASYDSNPDIPEANSQPCPSPANRKSPPNFSAKFRGVNDDDGHTLHNYL